jgi:hypothetical protein
MTDRRFAVPFDPEYFARRAAEGQAMGAVDAFRHAYQNNLWAGPESRSGCGAGSDQTGILRAALPDLCRRLGINTLLDLPCGDWNWMSSVALGAVTYIGADLLSEVVARNQKAYSSSSRSFLQLDLTASPFPAADLMLCRDCLVHLSFVDIRRALKNLRGAEIRYLLTTTFPAQEVNADIRTGDWRPLNLQAPPFCFPAPLELINEGCTESGGRFPDKSLGLWRVADVPASN